MDILTKLSYHPPIITLLQQVRAGCGNTNFVYLVATLVCSTLFKFIFSNTFGIR